MLYLLLAVCLPLVYSKGGGGDSGGGGDGGDGGSGGKGGDMEMDCNYVRDDNGYLRPVDYCSSQHQQMGGGGGGGGSGGGGNVRRLMTIDDYSRQFECELTNSTTDEWVYYLRFYASDDCSGDANETLTEGPYDCDEDDGCKCDGDSDSCKLLEITSEGSDSNGDCDDSDSTTEVYVAEECVNFGGESTTIDCDGDSKMYSGTDCEGDSDTDTFSLQTMTTDSPDSGCTDYNCREPLSISTTEGGNSASMLSIKVSFIVLFFLKLFV